MNSRKTQERFGLVFCVIGIIFAWLSSCALLLGVSVDRIVSPLARQEPTPASDAFGLWLVILAIGGGILALGLWLRGKRLL